MSRFLLSQLAMAFSILAICAAQEGFVHPGLLHSETDLTRMKTAVTRQEGIIYQGFKMLAGSAHAQADYRLKGPFPEVGRSPNIRPGECASDATAAYQNALMWAITGNRAHAEKAIAIINGWSGSLKKVTGIDGVLAAGLQGFKFANAAEILRHTDSGWSEADAKRCEKWFMEAWHPTIEHYAYFANGNWETAALQTKMAIAVFCNDRQLFEETVRYAVNGAGNGSIPHMIVHFLTATNEAGSSPRSAVLAASAGLPKPWTSADIGKVGTPGDTGFNGTTFTLEGEGHGIGGTNDGFHFAYAPFTGEGTITARIVGPMCKISRSVKYPVVIERTSLTSLFQRLKVRPMPKPRLIIPPSSNGTFPDLAIYHATSRVVHRQFLFQAEEKEQFRVLMRMYERFSGCRVLSYCVMTNHFHLLLEVPPPPSDGEFGISEEELIHRLGGLYSRAYVSGVQAEILEARMIAEGKREHFSRLSRADQKKEIAYGRAQLAAIFERFTKRMHSLSEFMRGLLQRYTRWFNKRHGMRGTLWEDRFHSVIVQSGLTSRTMAAYIDLNPVRAGICKDPADYRWSSYGEAVGGGRGATKAQSGLVRALRGHEGHAGTSRAWAQGGISKEYRKLLLTSGTEQTENCSDGRKRTHRKGMDRKVAGKEKARLENEEARDLKIAKAVHCKVRYFRDGAVLGSKKFVNDFFESQRDRFSLKRKDGARKARGSLKELAGEIWSLRDLKDG